jgi:hypothetical protein
MKRFIIFSITGLLLLGGIGIGLAIYNLQSLVDTLKPQIEAQLSSTLGVPVTIRKLEAHLGTSLGLEASGIAINSSTSNRLPSDKNLSSTNLPTSLESSLDLPRSPSLERLTLSVGLLPLLKKTVSISGLTLRKPQGCIHLSKEGARICGIPLPNKKLSTIPKEASEEKQKDTTTDRTLLPIALNIKDLSIVDGRIGVFNEVRGDSALVEGLSFSTSVSLAGSDATLRESTLTLQARHSKGINEPINLKISEILAHINDLTAEVRGLQFNAFGAETLLDISYGKETISGVLNALSVDIDSLLSKSSPLFPKPLPATIKGGKITARGKFTLPQITKAPTIEGTFSVGVDSVQGYDATISNILVNGSILQKGNEPLVIVNPIKGLEFATAEHKGSLRLDSAEISPLSNAAHFSNLVVNTSSDAITIEKGESRFNEKFISLENISGKAQIASFSSFAPLKPYKASGLIDLDIKSVLCKPLPDCAIHGKVTLAQGEAVVSPHAIKDAHIAFAFEPLKPHGLRVESSRFDVTANEQRLNGSLSSSITKSTIDPFNYSFDLNGGQIIGRGNVALPPRGLVRSQGSVTKVPLSALFALAQLPLQKVISGTLSSFNHEMKFELSSLMPSLRGPFDMVVENVSLKGINILGNAFQKIKEIPLLGAQVSARLPERLVRIAQLTDTELTSVIVKGSIIDQRVELTTLDAESDVFSLRTSGTFTLGDNQLSSRGSLILSERDSLELVERIKELRGLMNDKGRVSIPLTLSGIVPKVIVLPDIGAISKTSAGAALKEKAGAAVERLLEKKGLGDILRAF